MSDSPLGTSRQAHVVIRWDFSIAQKPSVQFSSTTFNFRKGNYRGFREELGNVDWKTLFGDKNVDTCYEDFLQVYYNLSLKWIPKTTRKSNAKRRAPGLTSEILDLSRSKTSLLKLNQATSWKNAPLIKDYKQTRDRIKKECQKSQEEFRTQSCKR